MNQIGFPLVSLILWLPALGGLLLLLLPRDAEGLQRQFALAVSGITFLLSLALFYFFDPTGSSYQMSDTLAWFPPNWGISYQVSISGLSLALLLTATFVMPLALAATWGSVGSNGRAFQSLLLVLETALIGLFTAQDLLLFYVFFELTLLPLALLVGIWGGQDRVAAAVKFFLYTFAGSVFMLLSIAGLYVLHGQATGTYTMDTSVLEANIASGRLQFEPLTERLLFAGFFLAFAIKAPLWPFHTWLPSLHAAAPASGAVDVAISLLKLGTYGLIRFNLAFFPATAAWAAPAIGVLAVISILYGAWVAFAQTDAKRLLAYSSLSHMGFVMLGIFSLSQIGIGGALLQMANLGISTGALFVAIGILDTRRQTRELAAYGGLWQNMPIFGGLTLLLLLSSMALPGLNGFVGEFTTLQGAWSSPTLGWRYVLPAVLGTVLAAVYLFKLFRQVFMGELNSPENQALGDISLGEQVRLGALGVAVLLLGLYPNLVFGPMEATVSRVVGGLTRALAGQ